MVRARVLSALAGIPLVALVVWVGGLPFTLAVLALALLGLWELMRAMRRMGKEVAKEVAIAGVIAVVLSAHQWHDQPLTLMGAWAFLWWATVLGSMGAFVFRSARAPATLPLGDRLFGVAATVFCIGYLSLFAFLVLLRHFFVSVTDCLYPVGRDLVFLVLASVWMTDSVAFFFGQKFGKRPLAPQVSPGKTLEGSLAGMLAGFVTAWLFAWLLVSLGKSESVRQVWLSLARPVPFALLALALGTVGQLGDLGKSVLKRDLGIKDFGALVPGHGGVLDRFDSLLATAPLAFLYARWVLG